VGSRTDFDALLTTTTSESALREEGWPCTSLEYFRLVEWAWVTEMRYVAFEIDTVKLLMSMFVRDFGAPELCTIRALFHVHLGY
jgi:hypothetical protein